MKTILLLLFTSLFALQGFFNLNAPQDDERYCAKLRDGKLVIMHEGSVITGDVTLENGTQIKTDGSIVKPDGQAIALKDGECVDKKGISEDNKPKKKE
ncbi:MAG: hypothetical protein M3R17_06900 [Bacteroidota bacterium]|nr:hypothetical protein [Bacteroidota bacterium]